MSYPFYIIPPILKKKDKKEKSKIFNLKKRFSLIVSEESNKFNISYLQIVQNLVILT